MMLLDILKQISGNFSTDVFNVPNLQVIASKVLPIMIPFLVNKSSSKIEFVKFLETINIFISKIEEKRMIVPLQVILGLKQ